MKYSAEKRKWIQAVPVPSRWCRCERGRPFSTFWKKAWMHFRTSICQPGRMDACRLLDKCFAENNIGCEEALPKITSAFGEDLKSKDTVNCLHLWRKA